MGKTEFLKLICERMYGNTSEENMETITEFYEIFVDIFTDALLSKDKILLKGFMSAEVIQRSERKGRNPLNNKITVFPPTKSIRCRMSKNIKDLVNDR